MHFSHLPTESASAKDFSTSNLKFEKVKKKKKPKGTNSAAS